jgi:PAS domain S-box-containing protein
MACAPSTLSALRTGAKNLHSMMNVFKIPSATRLERLPWEARGLLGCCSAGVAVTLTYTIAPLRSFPLLLAFPTVVLSAWFLGMWGGVLCAITDAILVDAFLTQSQLRFSIGNARESLRLSLFLLLSILLGWTIRRLARQRAQFNTQELEQRLNLANAERQLAEERARASEALRDRDAALQIALQANGMALWEWDLKEGTIHWSEEKYRMIGWEPGSMEPSIMNWFQSIHPDDAERVREAVARAREDGADYRQQYRVVWPDGSVHWLEAQGKCQRDSNGQATRIVGVTADVTHRKRAEDAMLRAEKLAIAGRLAASIAHEINNPLEAVSNLLFLITLAQTTEVAQEHARHGLEQLMRVSLITQQTLKFHRQAGTPKVTRLSEVLESVLALFRNKLIAADIAVDVRAEREIEVLCMPSETQQIFANLLSNAIDAMPHSGRLVIRLRPSTDWRDRKTAGMRVTFCDSGVGMDRETIRRIFEPFFTTKTETGTGLGMWVVAQLVERHQGQVRVWSRQGTGKHGTVFSVFLPFMATSAASEVENEPIAAIRGF